MGDLTHGRAYVNCSNKQIPIYDTNQMTEDHRIGTIYPNEMYCLCHLGDFNPNYWMDTIVFRDSKGTRQTGLIWTGNIEGSTETPDYLNDQVYFHRRNSNGSTLVKATSTTFPDGNPYMIFTVKKAVNLFEGINFKRNLPVGTRVAMDGSTVGSSYPFRISIDYVEENVNGTLTWVKKTNHWLDLGFELGSSPNNRALY